MLNADPNVSGEFKKAIENKPEQLGPTTTLLSFAQTISDICRLNNSPHTQVYVELATHSNGEHRYGFKAYIGSKGIIEGETIDEVIQRTRRAFAPTEQDLILVETPNPHGDDNYCVPETNVL